MGENKIIKRSDIKLLEQAGNNQWPITNEYRKLCVGRLMQIIADPSTNARTLISATRALAALDTLNQNDKQQDQTYETRNRFLDIAKRLGIRNVIEGTTAK